MRFCAAFGIWDIISLLILAVVLIVVFTVDSYQIRLEKRMEEELALQWADDALE